MWSDSLHLGSALEGWECIFITLFSVSHPVSLLRVRFFPWKSYLWEDAGHFWILLFRPPREPVSGHVLSHSNPCSTVVCAFGKTAHSQKLHCHKVFVWSFPYSNPVFLDGMSQDPMSQAGDLFWRFYWGLVCAWRRGSSQGHGLLAPEIPWKQVDTGLLFPSFHSPTLNVVDTVINKTSQRREDRYPLFPLPHLSTL